MFEFPQCFENMTPFQMLEANALIFCFRNRWEVITHLEPKLVKFSVGGKAEVMFHRIHQPSTQLSAEGMRVAVEAGLSSSKGLHIQKMVDPKNLAVWTGNKEDRHKEKAHKEGDEMEWMEVLVLEW